jgi:hypothetical protein
MADAPIFPDDKNVDNAKEFRSVQKDISEYYKSQVEYLKQRASITLSTQKVAEAGMAEQEAYVKNIEKQSVIMRGLMSQLITAEGTAADDLNRQIKSTKNLVNLNRDLLKMSQDEILMAIEADKRRTEESEKWVHVVKNGLQEILGLDTKQFDLVNKIAKSITDAGVSSKAFAYSIGAVVMMLKGAFDLFKKMDAEAAKFRMTMGMTRVESSAIRKDAERLAIDYKAMGVTIEGVYKSYQAIGQAVGGVHNVTKNMARDVSLMSSQLGISEETSANFMRNLAAVSKSSMESQTNMMGIAQAMASAAGVNLGEVMSDVAKASGPTLTMMSRLPNLALRSAIELRRMGTSLSDAAKSSRHMLDFQTSMDEEMTASVLLGRSINLQRARELAYRRDLEGSTKEILRITKSVDFANLDVFQQEAFAAATGKSVDELMKMLQTDKQIAQVKRSGTAQQKAELANYEKMRQENEKAAKARGKDAMVMLRTMANQERMTQLSNKWNQILAKAQSFLLPILDNVLGIALGLMDLAPIIMTLIKPVAMMVAWIGKWIVGGSKILSIFTTISSPLATMGGMFGKVGAWILKIGIGLSNFVGSIGKALGFFGKFLGFFGKWIPFVGWVIMAFQFIGNLMTRLHGIGKAFHEGVLNGIWFGLKAIGGAIYDTLVQPFVDAFKYIWSFFGGHSPSMLGMGIVKGIVGIGSMLFNAITSPYKMAFNWIINKFSGIGKFFGKLFGHGSVEKKAQSAYVPAVTVTPTGTQIETPKGKAEAAAIKKESESLGMTEETGRKMVALLEKILAKDSSIKMDGQLLSSTLARQTEFKGGYGVNKV